jgi:hypothetical protein
MRYSMRTRHVDVESEKREDTILRISEEMVMWHDFAERCEPGFSVMSSDMARDMVSLYVRMDERTAQKWRSFAMSMIDQCETRLREFTA